MYLSRKIEEARRPTVRPTPQDAAVNRIGYTSGVPIGGLSQYDQGAVGTIGQLDRRSYMTDLYQAYLACPWVSACVDVIARTITSGGVECVPDKWTGSKLSSPKAPDSVKEVQSLLKRVNPDQDIRQLMRQVITSLLIYGDSFTEVVYFMGKPIALYPLDAATMKVVTDPHGNVTGYKQEMDTGLEADFEPFEVIHVRMDDPAAGPYGISPLQKAYNSVTVWLFTDALIKETMKRGDPLRLWVDWPIGLPESEMKRFQQQFQVRNLGAKNIGNLFETKANTQVKELAVNQIEKWMAILDLTGQEIRSEYGVPAGKVGLPGSAVGGGSAVSTEDRIFTVNTCGPISELVLEKFTFRLLRQGFGITDWHMKFGDVDWRDDLGVEQILDIRVRNGALTPNAYREIIGQPPIPGGDVAIIVDRTNLIPVELIPDLAKANIAAVQSKGGGYVGDVPPPPGQTASPNGGGSLPAGTRSMKTPVARTPNVPRPKPVSRRMGGQNAAEALRAQWEAYEASRLEEDDE